MTDQQFMLVEDIDVLEQVRKVLPLTQEQAEKYHDWQIAIGDTVFELDGNNAEHGCRSLAMQVLKEAPYATLAVEFYKCCTYSALHEDIDLDSTEYERLFRYLVVLPIVIYTGSAWGAYTLFSDRVECTFPKLIANRAPHLVHLLLGGMRMAAWAMVHGETGYFISGSDEQLARAVKGDAALASELYEALLPNQLACDIRGTFFGHEREGRKLLAYLRQKGDYSEAWGSWECGCYLGEDDEPCTDSFYCENPETSGFHGHWSNVRDYLPSYLY
jgi:hypothetical protein